MCGLHAVAIGNGSNDAVTGGLFVGYRSVVE